MGQKINPISLRLASSTKYFDNSWYSDYNYTKLLTLDLSIYRYINSFFKFLKLPSTRFSIYHLPKITKLYIFFCYPRQSRELKSKNFQIPSSLPSIKLKKLKYSKPTTPFNSLLKKKTTETALGAISAGLQFSFTNNILLHQLQINNQKKVIPYFFKNLQTTFSEKNFYPKQLDSCLLQTKHTSVKKSDLTVLSFEKKSQTRASQIKLLKTFLILNLLKKNNQLTHLVYTDFQIKLFFKSLLVLVNSLKLNWFFFNIIEKSFSKNITCFSSFIYVLEYILNLQYSLDTSHIHSKGENNLKYKNYLQNYLSTFAKFNIQLIPFKVNQDWQSANYFADELVYFLERRVPFRRLKTLILKQMSQNPKIRGIRITCSGRVGGKSKKAQRTKIESFKYGQTSLHIFSSKIDFAARTAFTALGSTGIKIWICYN